MAYISRAVITENSAFNLGSDAACVEHAGGRTHQGHLLFVNTPDY